MTIEAGFPEPTGVTETPSGMRALWLSSRYTYSASADFNSDETIDILVGPSKLYETFDMNESDVLDKIVLFISSNWEGPKIL